MWYLGKYFHIFILIQSYHIIYWQFDKFQSANIASPPAILTIHSHNYLKFPKGKRRPEIGWYYLLESQKISWQNIFPSFESKNENR